MLNRFTKMSASKVMHRTLPFALSLFAAILLIVAPALAQELVSEARSVVQGIQSKGSTLSGELEEFHSRFAVEARRMVEIEAILEDLKAKGYIGPNYSDSPEKMERMNAEYADSIARIKETFVEYAPRIQDAVSDFNRSIYFGKDQIQDMRSQDLDVVDAELAISKTEFGDLKLLRSQLEMDCPENASRKSRNCQRQWNDYQRQLGRLKQSLSRLQYMKKISSLKMAIVEKLSQILDDYQYREADVTAMLGNYAFNFEQYASFIGSKNLGGMLNTINELKQLDKKMKDFQQFQAGLDVHVANMGQLVDDRLEQLMDKSGVGQVESRSHMLQSYADQEDDIAKTIRDLERG